MSHVVSLQVRVTDLEVLKKVLAQTGVTALGQGKYGLYSETMEGFGFKLNSWKYPCVVTSDGQVKYDNYKGSWGSPLCLESVIQKYSSEKVKKECRLKGYSFTETKNSDGSVKLTVTVGG